MSFWHGFTIVTMVHLLAAASPGPDFALVTRQSLLHGRRAGILTSFGIACGLSIHIFYSTAGLAAVIAHSAGWMIFIKLCGGTYLVYLGVKGLLAKPDTLSDEDVVKPCPESSSLRQISTGFFCNAFNPKAPLYFLSLFTVVLSPEIPLRTLAIYGAWIIFLQMLWFTTLAVFFTSRAIRERLIASSLWIDRVFGAIMILLGSQILYSSY